MTDTATEGQQAPEQANEQGEQSNEPDWKSEAEKFKSLSRKHEERAKANATAATELEKLRVSSMNDQERAVAEAKLAGRTEALVEAGAKVAAAEIRAAAAGRFASTQVETLLQSLDLRAFLDDAGEVDRAKVSSFIDGIAPQPSEDRAFPDLGQGSRTPNHALNGDPLLRDLKSHLGIR